MYFVHVKVGGVQDNTAPHWLSLYGQKHSLVCL